MSDSDAWAKACAEDLEAEKARRRAERGAEPGSAAEELRKLFDAVADKVGGLGGPLLGGLGGIGGQTVQQFVNQAKAAVEPVIERNPQVFDHLAAAGNELLAAYRSAVESHETRWTRGGTVAEDDPRREADTRGEREGEDGGDEPRRDDEGPGTGQHIDLD
ncbi:hypothetical protein AQF52_2162 [Streptomyces venezuelae]|uniref:DUF5304 domain-containing protein n=1 Tax=Streptomyces gardneri TaxID=66892 RepID=UPI0006BC995A|nr:DUF5304 domain-containing protein [Streptomyces gardneri]ALO07757.1 hypothetical protein AQF52_2162 [Streptomyces venezuelae]QPK45062.1 DUF5304 domain-containing protein [Streptomyces gardneri]WRK36378.1 DUF5304 domain-containing protein [Streptomyces venezuelae]CUM41908.1 FIG01121314: hypothetical protein [Streptomyces venezuelae]